MGQSEGTGQLVRDLWASGRTSQFFLREVGTTDASEQREVTRFRCSPAPPGGHGGWDRLGSKNKIRANETTWVQVNRMGGGCRGRQWKILVLTRMCSYIPGRNFDKTQVFYRETKPHNNCSLGQLLTDCPTEAVPMSCSRDKSGCELWAMLEMQLLAHLFFSPPLNKVFF